MVLTSDKDQVASIELFGGGVADLIRRCVGLQNRLRCCRSHYPQQTQFQARFGEYEERIQREDQVHKL